MSLQASLARNKIKKLIVGLGGVVERTAPKVAPASSAAAAAQQGGAQADGEPPPLAEDPTPAQPPLPDADAPPAASPVVLDVDMREVGDDANARGVAEIDSDDKKNGGEHALNGSHDRHGPGKATDAEDGLLDGRSDGEAMPPPPPRGSESARRPVDEHAPDEGTGTRADRNGARERGAEGTSGRSRESRGGDTDRRSPERGRRGDSPLRRGGGRRDEDRSRYRDDRDRDRERGYRGSDRDRGSDRERDRHRDGDGARGRDYDRSRDRDRDRHRRDDRR